MTNRSEEQLKINEEFIDYIQPKMVLDLYAGLDSFYSNKGLNVCSNDKNPKAATNYHLDALELLRFLYSRKARFDLIDFDSFESAYDCLDLAIQMTRVGGGICITLKDSTTDIIVRIQEIGKTNKKDLRVYAIKEWQGTSRVWFEVGSLKVKVS